MEEDTPGMGPLGLRLTAEPWWAQKKFVKFLNSITLSSR